MERKYIKTLVALYDIPGIQWTHSIPVDTRRDAFYRYLASISNYSYREVITDAHDFHQLMSGYYMLAY